MRECLRLLEGLTSFISKQALAHASSIGPAGILASSVILFYEPQQYPKRDGNVSQNDESGNRARGVLEERSVTRVRQPDRLEHAPDAVAQMESQQNDRENGPGRDPPERKSRCRMMVEITLHKLRLGVDVAGGELEEVEDDEGENDG